jgi:hypothetical protein
LETGAHTVELDGTGAGGAPRTATYSLTVTASTGGSTAGGATSAPVSGTGTSAVTLPFTGADSRNLASAALLALALGFFLLSISFRRNLKPES